MQSIYFILCAHMILIFGLCSCSPDKEISVEPVTSPPPVDEVYYFHANGSRHNVKDTLNIDLASSIEMAGVSNLNEWQVKVETLCSHSQRGQSYRYTTQFRNAQMLPIIDILSPDVLFKKPLQQVQLQCDIVAEISKNDDIITEISLKSLRVANLHGDVLQNFPFDEETQEALTSLSSLEQKNFTLPYSEGYFYWICQDATYKTDFHDNNIIPANMVKNQSSLHSDLEACRWLVEDKDHHNRQLGVPFYFQQETPKIHVAVQTNFPHGPLIDFSGTRFANIRLNNPTAVEAYLKIYWPANSQLLPTGIYANARGNEFFGNSLEAQPIQWSYEGGELVNSSSAVTTLRLKAGQVVDIVAETKGTIRCLPHLGKAMANCSNQSRYYQGLIFKVTNEPYFEVSSFSSLHSPAWKPVLPYLFLNPNDQMLTHWEETETYSSACDGGNGGMKTVNPIQPPAWKVVDPINEHRWTGCRSQ
ncbi:MAG: hypothetical protein KDD33_00180 [Bdellovibrionales bacterium]|nr:hypothetical protein [Bdellovibrionales bacterium]